MRYTQGITIVELLVVLVIAAVMLLGVNAFSNIGNQSYQTLLEEASVYNDISYAFKLMQSRVHSVHRSKIQSSGSELITENEKFGTYTHSGGRDLVYYPNRYDESINQVIFSVPDTGTLNFAYNINAIAGDVEVTLEGTKGEVPFDISTKIKSRRY